MYVKDVCGDVERIDGWVGRWTCASAGALLFSKGGWLSKTPS